MWVECDLICPDKTICLRPIEYTEPQICVHQSLSSSFPDGLKNEWAQQTYLPEVFQLIIYTMQVCLFIIIKK